MSFVGSAGIWWLVHPLSLYTSVLYYYSTCSYTVYYRLYCITREAALSYWPSALSFCPSCCLSDIYSCLFISLLLFLLFLSLRLLVIIASLSLSILSFLLCLVVALLLTPLLSLSSSCYSSYRSIVLSLLCWSLVWLSVPVSVFLAGSTALSILALLVSLVCCVNVSLSV